MTITLGSAMCMYLYYSPKVIKKIQLYKLDHIIYSYGIIRTHEHLLHERESNS